MSRRTPKQVPGGSHRFPYGGKRGLAAGLCAAVLAACGEGSAPVEPPRPAPAPPGVVEELAVPALAESAAPDASAGERAPDAAPEPPRATVEPGLPMLLDFTRDHCLPCEIMAPWVDELRKKHAGRVQVQEINIDRPENRELGLFFKTRSIPTQVYVDAQGREVSRHVGLATKPQMERTLEQLGFAPKR
jgi:thioredoxin 1